MTDKLLCDLRNPKLNAAETMRQAADEIERLRALICAWDDAVNSGGAYVDWEASEQLLKAVGR